jgi:hypothetical protein
MGAAVELTDHGQKLFSARRLEQVFNDCFAVSENTRLVGGAMEPLYRPAGEGQEYNLLIYREDFFASALHEIAHWSIAGKERRQLLDFGYWYAPEGRSPEQQRAFEAVEVKPQALEWFFSRACDYRFRVSVDNFNDESGEIPDTSDFLGEVLAQAKRWQQHGIPPRADQFYRALCAEFSTATAAPALNFTREELDCPTSRWRFSCKPAAR